MSFIDSITSSGGQKPISGVSSFTIREINGAKRTLMLRGRGLPHRPFESEVSQRVQSTYLPGYSRATLTLLGPEERSVTINGAWKDKYLAESMEAANGLGVLGNAFAKADQAVGSALTSVFNSSTAGLVGNDVVPITWQGRRVNTAREAVEIVDELCRTGAFVAVAWDVQAWTGVIKKFRKRWTNSHDCEWEIEFEWEGRDEPLGLVDIAQDASMSDTVSRFQQLADALNTEALPPAFPLINDAFRDLDQGIKRIADTTQRIADTVSNVVKLALAPAAALRQMISLFATIQGQANDLILTLRTSVPGSNTYSTKGTNPQLGIDGALNPAGSLIIGKLSFGQRMVARDYNQRVLNQLEEIRLLASEQQDAFTSKLDAEVSAVYTARSGDDLRTVSALYYGTPFSWQKLLAYNGLDSPDLLPGQIVLVPKLNLSLDPC